MLITCCTYSCTQYSLHTQYILLTNADQLLYLQLHTVSLHTQYSTHFSFYWTSLQFHITYPPTHTITQQTTQSSHNQHTVNIDHQAAQTTMYQFHCASSAVLTWQMGAMVPGQASMPAMSAADCQQAADTWQYVAGQPLAAGAYPTVSLLPQYT
jgi:hypothetical protein